jgi:DNA-binding HxlR family transcriptional regulator
MVVGRKHNSKLGYHWVCFFFLNLDFGGLMVGESDETRRVSFSAGVNASPCHEGHWNPFIIKLAKCHFVESVPARKPKHGPRDICSPAFEAVRRIGNESRVLIIKSLLGRSLRFAELMKVGVGFEPKTLSRILKYLESEGIIIRRVLSTRPVAVQYSLTDKGTQLKPVIDSLETWGAKWITPPEE